MAHSHQKTDRDGHKPSEKQPGSTLLQAPNSVLFSAMLWLVACALMLLLGDLERLSVLDMWRFHTQDDHMITMRVAANFAETLQPYFNKGEAVSANTSLFWPMILGSAYRLFDHQIFVLVVFGLSIALTAGLIVSASSLIPNRFLQAFVVICLSLSPPILRYGVSGWEHVPQAFFLTLALVQIAHASLHKDRLYVPISAFVLACMSFLFRPDSAILIVVIGIAWFFYDRRFALLKTYLIACAMLVLPISYLALMHQFYGEFVPNTAHLKVLTLSESLSYGVRYVSDRGQTWLFPYLLLVLAFVPRKNAATKLVLILGSVQLGYTILIGGDVFNYGRFYFLLLPITVAVLFRELVRVRETKPRQYLALSIFPYLSLGGYAIVTLAGVALSYSVGLERETRTQGHLRAAAFFNCALDPAEGSIGLHVLGTAYHLMDFHVVDFLGKAEPNIAKSEPKYGLIGHNKWDYPYIFSTYSIQGFPAFDDVVQSYRSGSSKYRIHNLSFMYAAVAYFETNTNYVYIPAHELGGKSAGVYLRPELINTKTTQTCLDAIRAF